jgi:hypothetical protein
MTEFGEFHERLAALGASGVADERARRAGPLAFRVDGQSWTYAPGDGGVVVTPGESSAAHVAALTAEEWHDFQTEWRSVYGLMFSGMGSFPVGGFEGLEAWEPALRSVWDGRAIYDGAQAGRDLAGFDLARQFTLDDATDELAAHLDAVGFALVKSVFTADEVGAMSDGVERQRAAASNGDGRSWWAVDAGGQQVCCRLIYLTQYDPSFAWLAVDGRMARFAALAGRDDLAMVEDRLDGVSVVIKNPSVVEGLSDLPWHRDCGLGGHPVLCPELNVGIQLDAATEATGQLHMLAGSHKGSAHMPRPRELDQLPIVAIDTEPGDVTLHYGHVFHAAPPPTGSGPMRRAIYCMYTPASAFEVVPAGQGYNDVIRETVASPST